MSRKDFLRLMGVLGAGAAAGGILTACGNKASAPAVSAPAGAVPATGAAPAAPKLKGTVKFWHVWGEERLKLVENQIKNFQTLHPEVKVEHTLLAQKGMQEKYLTAIGGGDPPDVIMVRRSEVPAFVESKALVPLDTYATNDKMDLKKVFYESEVQTSYYGGKLYALPHATGAGLYMIFNNVDAFKAAGLDANKPPKTLKELEQVSLAMTRKDASGKLTQMGFNILSSGFVEFVPFVLWLYAMGGKWLSDDAGKVAFNSPEGLETLEWMVTYVDKHGGMDALNGFVGTNQGTNRTAFYNGKLGMLNEGVFFFLPLKQVAPNLKYTTSELPYNDARLKNSVTYVEGGWGLAVPKGAKNPEAAWELLKFFTAGDGLCNFFVAQSRPTPAIQCNENPAISKDNPHWPVVDAVLKHGVAVPVSPAHLKIRSILTQMTEEALHKKKSPKDALSWGAAEVQKELDAVAAKRK